MRIKDLKGSPEWLIAIIVLLILIIFFILLTQQSKLPTIKPPISGTDQLTLNFDENLNLVVFDANGKALPGYPLDPKNSIGDIVEHLDRSNFKITGFQSIEVLRGDRNPSCNPIVIWGNSCFAPHTWCCPGN